MFFPSVVSRCDGFATGVGHKVFGEDFLAVFVDFTEGDCPKSCPLCGKGESSDTAKEIDVCRFIFHGRKRARAAE